MKKLAYGLLALTLLPGVAAADGRELATKKFRELESMSTSTLASGDLVPIWDESENKVKKFPANAFPGGSYDGSGITFSTTLSGNPLMQETRGVLTLAQVNAGTDILSSVSGRTIYPGNFMLMASGAAAGASGVVLRCRGSNNVISSVPIAMLTDQAPVGPFKSSGAAGTATPTLASALVRGCPVDNGVYISTTGTLTTTTHLYYSLPYVAQ